MSQVTSNLVKLKTMKVKLIVFLAIGAILAPMFVIGAMMGSFAPTKDKTGGNTGGFGSIGMAQVSADVLKWRPLVEKTCGYISNDPICRFNFSPNTTGIGRDAYRCHAECGRCL
nr:hypothetical protein [Bacillus cereus]